MDPVQPPASEKQSFTIFRVVSAIVALVAVGVVGKLAFFRSATPQESKEPTADSVVQEAVAPVPGPGAPVEATSSSTQELTQESVPPASTYKDGTYTADGAYRAPSGQETIGITLTIKADQIVDAAAQVHATFGRSAQMQKAFAGGFKEQIVGKNIDAVQLDKVSGSSLTPNGFNEALEKIKAQAKV